MLFADEFGIHSDGVTNRTWGALVNAELKRSLSMHSRTGNRAQLVAETCRFFHRRRRRRRQREAEVRENASGSASANRATATSHAVRLPEG